MDGNRGSCALSVAANRRSTFCEPADEVLPACQNGDTAGRPAEKKLLGRHAPRRPKRPAEPSCHHQLLLCVSSRAGIWPSRLIKEPLLSRYSGSAQVSVSGEKARMTAPDYSRAGRRAWWCRARGGQRRSRRGGPPGAIHRSLDAQRLHEMLHAELVSTAGALAFLFGEARFLLRGCRRARRLATMRRESQLRFVNLCRFPTCL